MEEPDKSETMKVYLDWVNGRTTEFLKYWWEKHGWEYIDYGVMPAPTEKEIEEWMFPNSTLKTTS